MNDNFLKGLVVFLSIISLSLIGYIVYDYVKDNQVQTVNKEESENNKIQNNDKVTNQNISNEDINKEVESILYRPVIEIMNYSLDSISYDINILSTKSSKIKFLWDLSINSEINDVRKKYDIDINGVELTGSIAINKEDFINKFAKVFGESITTEEIISNTNFIEKDGWIYGTYATGMLPLFVFKTVSFVETTTNTYSLTLDLLASADGGYDKVYEYDDPTILNYPTEVVFAKLNIVLLKQNDGTYQIKNLTFNK